MSDPRTARVWRNFQLAYELKGHQQSVWAVLAIEEQHVLTGTVDYFFQPLDEELL